MIDATDAGDLEASGACQDGDDRILNLHATGGAFNGKTDTRFTVEGDCISRMLFTL